jgi:hypothetical protein
MSEHWHQRGGCSDYGWHAHTQLNTYKYYFSCTVTKLTIPCEITSPKKQVRLSTNSYVKKEAKPHIPHGLLERTLLKNKIRKCFADI